MLISEAMPETAAMQHTLKAPATVAGMGLFTGHHSSITITPAAANAGIRFRRTDVPGTPEIPALVDYVVERPRRTTLQTPAASGPATSIECVEHLLSALAGMGVDNALVEVAGPEVPACDGSAQAFVEAIKAAGLLEQSAPRLPLVITEPVTVRDGEAMVAAFPSESGETELMYVLDHGPSSPLPRQIHTFTLSPGVYVEQIAPARTFSLLSEAKAAWERGLFRHLTPKDMLVIGDQGPIENAYRFEGEPVKHKLLDLLGDLSLAGRPILGRIVAVRSGHALNQRMARALLEQARPLSHPAVERPKAAMDIRSILRLLPHRYPMILVDRVLEIEADRRAVGVKNVSINEPFFQGHYPGSPIMPGVLIVEAMCQLAGLMLSHKLELAGKVAVLLSLDKVKLRKAVTPGDQLVMETETLKSSQRAGEVQARAYVSGELVAEALVKFLMVDAESGY